MSDYAISTSPEQDRAEYIRTALERILAEQKDRPNDAKLLSDFARLQAELNAAGTYKAPEPISTPHLYSKTSRTYQLSETFAGLNAGELDIVRDGLVTIGAEANTGKSSFITHLGIDILRHNPGTALLYYTLDDSKAMAARRIMSQLHGRNMRRDTPTDQELRDAIANRIYLQDSINLRLIMRDAEIVMHSTRSDRIIIAIDYLQIMPTDGQLLRESLNATVKELKEIQKSLNCMMLIASRLNRNTDSTTYRYRETSEIENQSDVCLDMYHLTEPGSKKPDYSNSARELRVSKNKMGQKGITLRTSIDSHFRFSPLQRHRTFKRVTEKDLLR
jgi:replicative DNA helicase